MSNPAELETIETDHHREMGEALNELRKNPNFQKVIMDGYLRDRVLASTSLLAVPAIKEKGKRSDVMEDLVAASNLQYYFQMVDSFYQGTVDPILSDEEEAAMQAEEEARH